MPGARAEEDRVAELGVLPDERQLDVLGPVPVEADVDRVEAVGPEVGVGQAGGEDLVADVEQVVAPDQLERPRPEPAGAEVEVAERLDRAAAG